MEKRTKVLIIMVVVLGIAAAGSFFYRHYKAQTAPQPKFALRMGAPIKKGAKAKSKPAGEAGHEHGQCAGAAEPGRDKDG